jgi:RNA polymerase sigma-70 factor (ECF subfamily)
MAAGIAQTSDCGADDRFSSSALSAPQQGQATKTDHPPHEGAPLSLQEQVAQLYEESREDIYRYIVLMGVPREQAQEICQEAFLRLYSALHGGQQIENTRAWVFTVARNQALTQRAAPAAFASLEDKFASESPTPEESLLDGERFRRLRNAVALLTDSQRQCLHLRTKGFRYREIASILGISTSTAAEAVQRAVAKLRKAVYE